MRKSGCNKLKLRVRVRPRNGGISLFQRFLMMGASTADCIRQRAESIPELHESRTFMRYRLLGKSGLRVSEGSPGAVTFGDEDGILGFASGYLTPSRQPESPCSLSNG